MNKFLSHIQNQAFGILIFFTLLSVIGISLIPRLAIQYLPQYKEPGFSVKVMWPGAPPHIVERQVISILEASFALVPHISGIYSESEFNGGTLTLDLDRDTNLDFLRYEIATKIRQVYPAFPEGVQYPEILTLDPDREIQDRPILTYSLGGNDDVSTIYRYALESLSPSLALTDGIQKISVHGGQQQEWIITYKQDLLEHLNLEKGDILNAIRNALESREGGITKIGNEQYTVRIQNYEQRPEQIDWEKIPLQSLSGRLLLLSDVASIQKQDQVPHNYYRINGQNSVRILVYPEDLINHLNLANKIQKVIGEMAAALPDSYHLYLEDDATEYLRQELNKIKQRTLLSLGILMVLLLLAYFNARYFFVITLSLLVNLFLASIFYYTFRVQLHLYALAGITVSFGIIIDNAIVMSHHLYRQKNLWVFPALAASTLTTLASLTVIFFLPPQWQASLTDFAKVLAINLTVSLVVALVFIPALLTKVNLNLKTSGYNRVIDRLFHTYEKTLKILLKYRVLVIGAIILLFGTPIFLLPNKINDWNLYNNTLGNEWYVEHVKPLVNKAFGGTLRLFAWYVYEGSSFREPEETVLYVRATMPPGSTVAQMNDLFIQVENYLRQFPVEIKKYVSNIFSGDYGHMSIYFNPGYDISFPFILKNRLISFSTNTGGVSWSVYGVGRGFSTSSGSSPPRFSVAMYGYNEDELKWQSQNLADLLLKHPRIQEVNTNANINWYERDKYAFQMQLDDRKMVEQKIRLRDISRTLTHYNQAARPDFYLAGTHAIRLVSDQQHDNDLWSWQHREHPSDSGRFQFSSIGQIEKKKMAQAIHKENQQYIRLLEFEYTGSHRFGSKYLDECLEQMDKIMPVGYSAERKTYSFWGKEKRKQYSLILLVIGLIFFISTIHFESFRQALAVIALIPISFIGIFLIFYWFDGSFDQGGYTSFLLLSGLVVNSLILIINDYNHFRKSNIAQDQISAYLLAFRHKFFPILLTILSTTLGMIPFLMHGRQEVFWHALALGTIGGLMFSILVLLFVIPVFLLPRKIIFAN